MASVNASTMRSSGLLSQSSPNLVQPMPMMATLSLMPSAILPPSLFVASYNSQYDTLQQSRRYRLDLPEVAHYAVGLVRIPPAEGHLHRHIYLQRLRFGIGDVQEEPSSTLPVDDPVHLRRADAESQAVGGVADQAGLLVGEAILVHLIDRSAVRVDADALPGVLGRTALPALRPVEIFCVLRPR